MSGPGGNSSSGAPPAARSTRALLDRRARRLVTAGVMGSIFLAALDLTAVSPAMPRIVGTLGGGELYAWAFSVYAVLSTTTTPLFGRLSDRLGRRPVLLLGVGIFLVGSLACATALNMPLFIAARAVQGLGAGALLPVAFTIVGDIYDLRGRARVQGFLSGVWGVASVVGPLVGGTLVATAGWRWIFLLNFPIGLGAATLVLRHLREAGFPHEGTRLDLAGGLFFSGAILLALVGMKLDGTARLSVALAALATAGLFVWRERKAPDPLFDLTLFRLGVYRAANLSGFFAGAVLLSLSAYLPVYIINVRGGTAMLSGLMLTPLSAGWVLAATVCSRLLLTRSARSIVLPGLSLLVAATIGVSRVGAATPYPLICGLMFLSGVGFGMSMTVFLVSVQEEVEARRRGQATAGVQFFRQIGGAVGVAVLEAVVLWRTGDPGLMEASPGRVFTPGEQALLGSGIDAAFLVAAGFAVAALLGALPTPRRRRPVEHPDPD